jgi:hypothetical protein
MNQTFQEASVYTLQVQTVRMQSLHIYGGSGEKLAINGSLSQRFRAVADFNDLDSNDMRE